MIAFVALALWLALPVPAPGGGDPPQVTRSVAEWVEAQRAVGRVLEPLGTRVVGERTWATFVDRTGGCLRGWARLRMTVPAGSAVAREVEEHLGAACDQPALPMNHFLRLATAIWRKDWVSIGELLPHGGMFPIGREDKGKQMRRSTHDREQVLAGKGDFPACDPFEDTPSCDAPRPSGRVTCTCSGASGALEVDLQLPRAGSPDPVELVALRHQTGP